MSAQSACNQARKESFSVNIDAPGSLIVAEQLQRIKQPACVCL
jgi:hypothetical protein